LRVVGVGERFEIGAVSHGSAFPLRKAGGEANVDVL